MNNKHVLIVGASGVVGFAAHDAFHQAGWQITTLGRSSHSPHVSAHLSADLTALDDLNRQRAALESVTHIFYAALKQEANPGVEADINALMFENLVTAVRSASHVLRQIIFIQGGRYMARTWASIARPHAKKTAAIFRQISIFVMKTTPDRWKRRVALAGPRCVPILSLGTLLDRR